MTGETDPAVPFRPDRFRFVLVEPRAAGNVGATARALKNLGYSRLSLVRPHCDPLGSEARTMAVDARDLLARVEIHDGLDSALAGAAMVLGATARKGRHRRPHWRLDQLSVEAAGCGAVSDVVVVFGREDRGLHDEELDACTHLVYLPGVEIYPSFNLAQAVLLVAYELRRSSPEWGVLDPALDPPAPHESRESMFRHLSRAFEAIGYTSRDTGEVILRRYRRLIGRAQATPLEVSMLRGLARQVLWAADQAGLIPRDGPDGLASVLERDGPKGDDGGD